MKYTDLFIDFDDTLYDTHGNAVIALGELFEALQLGTFFPDPDLFYDEYWKTNIDLWTRYSKGEITRDYLIVERFRRPLSFGQGLEPTEEYCLKASDLFLDFCSEVQYKKLRACGLHDCFDTIILSEDAGANKPSRQYFDYAFKVSGASKEQTLMIGDNFNTDILGAKQAGLDTAYFNRFPDYPAPEPVTFEVTALRELMEIL